MKVRACFVLFGIFANTQSLTFKPEISPKTVNIALNTVLEFHHEDKKSDIKLLDDIQNVIKEIRTIILDKNNNVKNIRRNFRDETFTDFIQDVVKIINTYDDTTFEDFIQILDAEITLYDYYRGCKFSELMENHETEELITGLLDSIKSRPTYVKKMKINDLSDVLKYENYDRNVKNIVDYINSLYNQAGDKFRRFLSNLEGYGKSKSSKSNTNLVKIIKNGLRSIIFDHYTNLSMNSRRHLRHQIKFFWERYKKSNTSKRDNVAKVTPYNTTNSKNIINEANNFEADSKRYQKNTNNKIKKKWIKAKQSPQKNKITKKYDLKNENKNTRKETIDESLEIQENKTRRSSQNTDNVVQQRDEIKLQGQTGDVDSLSASFSSIELPMDQLDNTQQFIAIVLDKYTQKSTNVTKKPHIIDTLNVRTKTPIHNINQKKALWIEQSTGRLPKAVLDKLANKSRRSNPDLTGKNLNQNGPKHKKNKDKNWWHRRVNKPDETRRKGYEPENSMMREKIYDPQNHKTLRYSELIRDKINEKKNLTENEKTYGKIYEQAGDKTRGNINEPENDKSPGSVYESENDKSPGSVYESENDKSPGSVYESENEKMHDKISELGIGRAEGNIYDRRQESERPTKHRFEFDSNYEMKEDTKYKYKKNLNPNEPTNIKRYDTEHEKIQGKIFKPEYRTHGKLYEPEQDKMRGNKLHDKHKTKSAIKNQFIYESKENKKHKRYNTSKPRKPSIVKHNHRDLFSQHDVRTTNSLFNNKDEEVQQYNETKIIEVGFKHDNRPIRTTAEGLQLLDVQIITEPGTTRKAPTFSRATILKLDDTARMKPTHQTFSLNNSSIGWLPVELPLKAYSKSNNKWSRKHERYSRKSTEYSTSFKEGITAGNIEIIDDYRLNAQTTPFSYIKDSYVNESIKTFEGQLNEDLSRTNDNTEEGRNVKHRFEVKSYVVKPKQVETFSTLNDTLRQDTLKMADTADDRKDLTNYVTDKDSKIKDDVVRGITLETMFRSGVVMIPVDLKVKDKLKTTETAVNKTEFSIEDHINKYAENNKDNGKKSEIEFKSGLEIPSDNIVKLNVSGAGNNETDLIIEHVVDEDSKNNENKIEKAEKLKTRSKSNANNVSKVTQNNLKMEGTTVNETEHIMENNNTTDKDSTNNDKSEIRFRSDLNMIHKDFKDMTNKTEVTETADNITEYKDTIINIENGKMSEINFPSNINMMPNDFNDKTDQTNRRTADIKTDFIEKENDFKSKEEIVDKDHQIYQVDDETSIIREAPKEKDQIEKDTQQQYIDDITFKAKYRDMKDRNGETLTKDSEIKLTVKDQKEDFLINYYDYDASKGTQTLTTNITSTSSSMKVTESTTKASATTVVLAAPTTPKLPVFIPVVWKNAKFNAIVNENKMSDTLPDLDVNGEVQSKVDTNATNV